MEEYLSLLERLLLKCAKTRAFRELLVTIELSIEKGQHVLELKVLSSFMDKLIL